jgi:hypothetical protein
MRVCLIPFVLLVVLAAAPTASGQAAQPPTMNLAGELINPDTGLPIAGVKLSLVGPGEYLTKTDGGGRFVFKNIPQVRYGFLFAFPRGDDVPPPSVLVAKGIPAGDYVAKRLRVSLRQILERPVLVRPVIKDPQYDDGRERKTTRAIVFADHVGLTAATEFVTVTVDFESGRVRKPSLRVVDGVTGHMLPFQLLDVTLGREDFVNSCRITFPAQIMPGRNRAYMVAGDAGQRFRAMNVKSDLKLEPRKPGGDLVLSNAKVAFRLPPAELKGPLAAAKCPAPIIEMRGPDNVWFGTGRLVSDREVASVTCEEVETGPLFKEMKITYTFDEVEAENEEDALEPGSYELTLRLYSQHGHLMMTETMRGEVDLEFQLSVHANLSPDRGIAANGASPAFPTLPTPKRDRSQALAVLRAWNPPGVRKSHYWYGVMSSGNRKDAVGLVQVNGAGWAFADRNAWFDGTWLRRVDDADEVRLVATGKPDVYFAFPHRPGTRQFALVVFDKTRNWDPEGLAKQGETAASQQKAHVLNRRHVAESQLGISAQKELGFDADALELYPRLTFQLSEFPKLKERFEAAPDGIPPELIDVFAGVRARTPLIRNTLIGSIQQLNHAFAGRYGDRAITGFAGAGADVGRVDPVVKYGSLLYDANSRSGLFSVREEELLLAVYGLVAMQLEHPNFAQSVVHDPALMARRDAAISMASMLLSFQPQSSRRLLAARERMVWQLRRMLGTGGLPLDTSAGLRALNVWAETASAFEHNTGYDKVASSPFAWTEFTAEVARLPLLTAPPDPRYGGRRLLPPLGDSRAGDAEGLAVLAGAARRLAARSPEFAARLWWAWEQAGRPVFRRHSPFYRLRTFAEPPLPELEARPPDELKSAPLGRFGALLRARFNRPGEGYLLFKCCPYLHGSHLDQGSLVFHAFGAPLLVDTGLPLRRQATWAHNTIRLDGRPHAGPGGLVEFHEGVHDDYAVGRIVVDRLSPHREYTPSEFAALQKAAGDGPFSPPPGHRADGSQTLDMLAATEKLDEPIRIERHLLFRRDRQSLVILDRVHGAIPSDVFFNVHADQARLTTTEGGARTRFVGPYGVDLDVRAFGSGAPTPTLEQDAPQRWILRLSQPAATPRPPKEPAGRRRGDKEPEPIADFLTVLSPVVRAEAGLDVRHAAPDVQKLRGLPGVRIAEGNTVRYVVLATEPVSYQSDEVRFTAQRMILTARPTHFDVTLFDGGEAHYGGRGVRIDHGIAHFRIAPGGFVDGRVSGPRNKRVSFYGAGVRPRKLSFKVDGQDYLPDRDSTKDVATYGIKFGSHSVTLQPTDAPEK